MIKKLQNINEFNDEISKDYIVVDFYADWCGPCNMLSPILDDVATTNNIEVLKVNIDEFGELAMKYGVMVIPTIMIFEKSKVLKSNTGVLSKSELEEFLRK